MSTALERLAFDLDELNAVLERARARLDADDYDCLARSVAQITQLLELLESKRASVARLRQLLFGTRTEKADKTDSAGVNRHRGAQPDKPSPRGHGRRAADEYRGATEVQCRHPTVHHGERCPRCERGKLYNQPAGQCLRIVGQAPLAAHRYQLEKLRCNLCGERFTAPLPEDAGTHKYHPGAANMMALLKYGAGLPFNRLANIQAQLGVPLPASTQWDIVQRTAGTLQPVFEQLIRHAAHGQLLHNDDTHMRVLELNDPERRQAVFDTLDPERSGVFTSAIVSAHPEHTIALFFTGARHAGENLNRVLQRRARALEPPIQMCDALSRNLPGELQIILANCLAHARRKFFECLDTFPQPCQHVIDALAKVYHLDAQAKRQALSQSKRLAWHQEHSAPVMDALFDWLNEQIDQHHVEPNSPLGDAIAYFIRHWTKLTRFLHVPGAPLDNNVCERALKKAILHRKSALFFKTLNGARVGDLFMSIIHTCYFARANPFDYLNALQNNIEAMQAQPQRWMPWNYLQNLPQPP